MFTNIIGCYLIVAQLSPAVINTTDLINTVKTCAVVAAEAKHQDNEDIMSLHLAVAWQESRFTMDAKGKWLCTGKGKLSFVNKKPKCSEGTLTRAMGPMQILPVYHCKGKAKCNYVKESVSLLSRLTTQYGIAKGLEVYAGGYSGSSASKKYARMTLYRATKIDKILDFVYDLRKLFSVPT